jgi:LPXTG-site transpeptidase (sortase) family protein
LVPLDVVDGTMQVPEKWHDVGWWEDGPNPGAAGSAVLVGHVDSVSGPAVFYGLSTLRKGDLIHVRRLDNTTATFRVDHSKLVEKNHFPSKQVYRLDGSPTLRLVTCGGAFDEATGHYTENLVVTAHLVTKAGHDSR